MTKLTGNVRQEDVRLCFSCQVVFSPFVDIFFTILKVFGLWSAQVVLNISLRFLFILLLFMILDPDTQVCITSNTYQTATQGLDQF